jgi:plasmid rolling circle replication initiator protein Rep
MTLQTVRPSKQTHIRENPYIRGKHTYLDKRVTKAQRNKPRTRSEVAENRLRTKKHLIALASELGELKLADSIKRCHSHLAVLTCGRHVPRLIPNHVCEFRLCPDCGRRRARKLFNKYLPMLEAFKLHNHVTPVHLVLTQTHRAENLEQSVNRLRKPFEKLTRRRFWKDHFKGGMWSLEVTKGKDGFYHTHLHIIAFRTRFFDIELLRSEWKVVTGDSENLHLKPILDDLKGGLSETLKYVAKPLSVEQFTAENLRHFLRLKNMRFFGTFGEFRKFCRNYEPSDNADVSTLLTDPSLSTQLTEGCVCPQCDQPLFEVRLSGDELPSFLRRIEASSQSPPKT